MLKTDLVLIVVQVSVVCCQLGEYRPRGGHFISNGQYQNQEQPSQNFGARGQPVNFNFQQQPQMSNNVIGNVAENSYSGMQVNSNQVVNSIIGPSIGSSNNVIGNKAFNTNAGTVNSILINPNIPGLQSPYNPPWLQQILSNVQQRVYTDFGSYNSGSY